MSAINKLGLTINIDLCDRDSSYDLESSPSPYLDSPTSPFPFLEQKQEEEKTQAVFQKQVEQMQSFKKMLSDKNQKNHAALQESFKKQPPTTFKDALLVAKQITDIDYSEKYRSLLNLLKKAGVNIERILINLSLDLEGHFTKHPPSSLEEAIQAVKTVAGIDGSLDDEFPDFLKNLGLDI